MEYEVTVLKIARFFAVIFAVAGIVVMLGSAVVCFASLDSSVKILEYPQEAAACSESLRDAVLAGDYAALQQLLYGEPQLGGSGAPQNPVSARIWEAFRTGLTFEYTGNLYLLDSQLSRDARIGVPDVSQLLERTEKVLQSLLNQKVLAAEDPLSVRTPDGTYRNTVVDQALPEALEQVLSEELPYITHTVTIQLTRRDDRWWVLPDQAFLTAISGPAA